MLRGGTGIRGVTHGNAFKSTGCYHLTRQPCFFWD